MASREGLEIGKARVRLRDERVEARDLIGRERDLDLLDATLQHERRIAGKARRCRRATPGRGEQREHKDGREG